MGPHMRHSYLGRAVLVVRMWCHHATLSHATDLCLSLSLSHLSLSLC